MNNSVTHIAAPRNELYYRYEVCPHVAAKVLLLTVGGVCVVGTWHGKLNEAYRAWCPLPIDTQKPEMEPIYEDSTTN